MTRLSISPVVDQAESFKDLLALPGGDGIYRFTTMFREAEWRERRAARRNFKLLKRMDGEIRDTLFSGEWVHFLTTARGLSFWERWVVGWRRAVVLTDGRLILFQLGSWGWPTPLRSQLSYDSVEGVEVGRWGHIRVALGSSGSLTLRGVPRDDRETVTEILNRHSLPTLGEEHASGLQEICPYCGLALEGRPGSCPRCLRGFKRPWIAAFLSLLVPGAGNYYLDHKAFAVLELLAAAALWIAYLFGAEMWGYPELRSAVEPRWFFAAIHGSDALFTWYVGRRGIYPKDEE